MSLQSKMRTLDDHLGQLGTKKGHKNYSLLIQN